MDDAPRNQGASGIPVQFLPNGHIPDGQRERSASDNQAPRRKGIRNPRHDGKRRKPVPSDTPQGSLGEYEVLQWESLKPPPLPIRGTRRQPPPGRTSQPRLRTTSPAWSTRIPRMVP